MAVSRSIMKSLFTVSAIVSFPDFENGPSHIPHVDEEIGPLSSPQALSSDPGKSDAAKVIGPLSYRDLIFLSELVKSYVAKVIGPPSDRDLIPVSELVKSYAAKKTGALSYLDQFLPFNPGKFHVQEDSDKYGYAQSHYHGSDTGMSGAGAGAGKGQDGEPTKDDERTLAWKLRLSVKAVTPKFSASAKISLEKKSG